MTVTAPLPLINHNPLPEAVEGHQAFLLVSSCLSPLKLWSSMEQAWPEVLQQGVQWLWSAPLYGRHGAGLYVTAISREEIEAAAEGLQALLPSSQVEIRLCKNDGHRHPMIDVSTNHPVQGLVAISLLPEAQTRESEVVGTLQTLTGVQQVRACYGETDIWMLLAASDLDAFREVLVHKIRGTDGVATTGTRLVYASHCG